MKKWPVGNIHVTHYILYSNPGINVQAIPQFKCFPWHLIQGGRRMGIVFIVYPARFVQNSVSHQICETLVLFSFHRLPLTVRGWSTEYIGHPPNAIGKIINVPAAQSLGEEAEN